MLINNNSNAPLVDGKPMVASRKFDGIRVLWTPYTGEIISRGNYSITLPDFVNNTLFNQNTHLDCELVVVNEHKMSTTHSDVMAAINTKRTDRLMLAVFDVIPPVGDRTTYIERYSTIPVIPCDRAVRVELYEYPVPDMDELVKSGWEGLVVRSIDGVYLHGKRAPASVAFKIKVR
jgi:ATP-dependent DNA ligase